MKNCKHDFSLFPHMNDTRLCRKCDQIEVFVDGKWNWHEKGFEKAGWKEITKEEIEEL